MKSETVSACFYCQNAHAAGGACDCVCHEKQNLLALLKEAHEHLECYDAKKHSEGTCLDKRIEAAIAKVNR